MPFDALSLQTGVAYKYLMTLTAQVATSFTSDARLFYENKQGNLKNTPKSGNLTEKKQAQFALVGKLKKHKANR